MSLTLAGVSESELVSAIQVADRRNDLFPPRDGDKVAGRIATGFARGLRSRLRDGSYRPDPADFVAVRKSGLMTRPAAVLTLKDRVVYEAIVARTRVKIQRRLPPIAEVLWPRADATAPSYSKLDDFVLADDSPYVVIGDVAGFYESIDHTRLRRALSDAGVDSGLADDLVEFLGHVMKADRGLPQGLGSSDSLATLYLSSSDRMLIAEGVRFTRHGDDYRLLASSPEDSVRVAHLFERALRENALLPNARKLEVVNRLQYETDIRDVREASDAFRKDIQSHRVTELAKKNDNELAELADQYEIDEDAQWRYFYHGAMEPREFRELIAPFLTPSAVEVLEEMYVDATNKTGDIPPQLRHARLVYCLQRLAGARAVGPLATAGAVLNDFPDETDDVCSYLLSVSESEPKRVAAVCVEFLQADGYQTDWQRAWVLRVLSRCAAAAPQPTAELMEVLVKDASMGWLPRVEAARVLAVLGSLAEDVARAIWKNCPEAYRSDIAGIVAANSDELSWGERFLDGVREDHLSDVIVKGIFQAKAQEGVKPKGG